MNTIARKTTNCNHITVYDEPWKSNQISHKRHSSKQSRCLCELVRRKVFATLNMRIVWCHNIRAACKLLYIWIENIYICLLRPLAWFLGQRGFWWEKSSHAHCNKAEYFQMYEYNAPWKTIIIIKIIYCFPVCLCRGVGLNFCMYSERLRSARGKRAVWSIFYPYCDLHKCSVIINELHLFLAKIWAKALGFSIIIAGIETQILALTYKWTEHNK